MTTQAPRLKKNQRTLPAARRAIIGGGVIGVTIGCVIGASCLLFMDLDESERKKKASEMETILDTVMRHGDSIIGAERCSVFIVDKEKKELWSKYVRGENNSTHSYEDDKVALLSVPIEGSLVGLCCESKEVVNIGNVKEHPSYNAKNKIIANQNKNAPTLGSFNVKDILCAPVIIDGEVVAVVEFLNKVESKKNKEDVKPKGSGGLVTRRTTKVNCQFSENDEKLATMLAHHVALFMKKIEDS